MLINWSVGREELNIAYIKYLIKQEKAKKKNTDTKLACK